MTLNMLDKMREKRPKSFRHWRVSLFFQKFEFSTNSYVIKNWSYNDHSKRHNTLWTLTKCPLRFVTLASTRENRQKPFLHCRGCLFFLKNCVFNNLSSPKELLLSQTQSWWKNLEDGYKLSFEVCDTQYYEKKWAKN